MVPPIDIILERMRNYDPNEIVELLDITAEELIDRFKDKIEDRTTYLAGEFELFNSTDEDYEDEPEVHPITEIEEE
jgi:hypothetical protein